MYLYEYGALVAGGGGVVLMDAAVSGFGVGRGPWAVARVAGAAVAWGVLTGVVEGELLATDTYPSMNESVFILSV